MHIDYIRDAAHLIDGPPTELNISVIPSVPTSVAATAICTIRPRGGHFLGSMAGSDYRG